MSEKKFYEFNLKNILENLIQAEDHLRYKTDKTENLSCFYKHVLFVRGEVKEAISHASKVDQKNVQFWQNILAKVEELIEKPDILKVREIRKEIEKRFPKYNTAQCELCEIGNKIIKNDINIKEININKENKIMDLKPFVHIGGGIVLGEVEYNLVTPRLPRLEVAGFNLTNVIVGAAQAFLSEKYLTKVQEDFGRIVRNAGIYLALREIATSIASRIVGAITPTPAVTPAPTFVVTPTVTYY